jgi:outer membrane biosynthesis protein TonB
MFAEEMPEPLGGFDSIYNFISSKLSFTEIEKNNLISSQAFVNFIVEKDGTISNVKVLTSDNLDVNYEIIRVVRMMPPWKAGKDRGEPVRCFYTIPIKFTLEDK